MKCAAYIRTASKNHVDDNLRKQTEMIKAFILKNNWELDAFMLMLILGLIKTII
jgi:DNA invertase Pin-like site-specific DNA recombinase